MSKFLYGASVQGIQKFIFETGKLKEIIGASEIVEKICTKDYKQFVGEKLISEDNQNGTITKIIAAAGNIKLYSEDKDDFKELVRDFPKFVQEKAPGITISQAVVKSKNDEITQDDIIELELRLKTQRNKPIRPIEITGLGIERSRRTGKSALKRTTKDGLIDSASQKKLNLLKDTKDEETNANTHLIEKLLNRDESQEGEKKLFPLDFSGITRDYKSNWLAVIHADGNSLGKTIQTIFTNSENLIEEYKNFSENLNIATTKSAKEAFEKEIYSAFEKEKLEKFPFRPIIIGGDDLTVICRADLAIPFTKAYLENFEKNTNEIVDKKLTGCAGIAFIKEKFPFHYAIELAEELCGVAKSKSKEINSVDVPASIMFHKVKSSFVDSYEEIKNRELFAKASQIKFSYGPYSINKIEGMHHIGELLDKSDVLRKENSPKSGLRKIISELNNDKESAKQLLKRIIQITNSEFTNKLGLKEELKNLEENNPRETIIYDLLTILSLEGGK